MYKKKKTLLLNIQDSHSGMAIQKLRSTALSSVSSFLVKY